jgi:F-type H+-transporting ATPase subunit a
MKHDSLYKGLKLLFLLVMVFALPTFANEGKTEKKEAFSPGKFIIGHISDSYSWHVTSIGKKDISIPLLVIVKSQDRGWFVFSSAKFEHGHAAYQGFKLSESKKHNGKVVEILPNDVETRPLDLSITKNVASLLISAALLLWIFLSLANFYKRKPMASPKGFQGALEFLVIFIQDEVIRPGVGKDYLRYSPYLLTLFFFILINNILGAIPIFPGGANLTGNIATTMTLAVLSFLIINIFASKEYWRDIFLVPSMPSWLRFPIPLMPFLELVSVFTKPIALMVRLFANMLAGHMILMVFMAMIFIFGAISPLMGTGVSVIAVAFALFMSLLELLVIFLQAYVFTLLSSVFIGMSRIEPHNAPHLEKSSN